MALKRYVSARVPNLRIGGQIKFYLGIFETEKKFLQDLIEANDVFGSQIRQVPTMAEANAVPAPVLPDMTAAVEAVMNNTPLPESEPEPEEKEWADLTFMKDEIKKDISKPWHETITATELNKASAKDLRSMAEELDVDPGDKNTAYHYRRAIRLKLGV